MLVKYAKYPSPFSRGNIIVVTGKGFLHIIFNMLTFLYSGRCVCDDCSREKVRIPKFDDRTLFKVCSDCAKYFKEQRTYGV